MTGRERPRPLEVLSESGPLGLALRAGAKILRTTGTFLAGAADRLAAHAGTLSRADRRALAPNGVYADRYRGRRCFVIGNGPSLATQDLAPLAGELTFVMSAFFRHTAVERWQPTYYCFADPLFFDGSATMRDFFGSLGERVRDATFLVPLHARRAIAEQGLLPEDRLRFVAFGRPLAATTEVRIDLRGRVSAVQSVSQLAILAAMFMGCSPIYLLGLDHDWLSHRGLDRHFYQGYAGLEKHPQVQPDLKKWRYRDLMESQLALWRGYEALDALARRAGIRILNATGGGFLDVFEGADYALVVADGSARGGDRPAGTASGSA